jgi:hypothetical protein
MDVTAPLLSNTKAIIKSNNKIKYYSIFIKKTQKLTIENNIEKYQKTINFKIRYQ